MEGRNARLEAKAVTSVDYEVLVVMERETITDHVGVLHRAIGISISPSAYKDPIVERFRIGADDAIVEVAIRASFGLHSHTVVLAIRCAGAVGYKKPVPVEIRFMSLLPAG